MKPEKITFKRTAHNLLNNGIIGVYSYLERANEEKKFNFAFDYIFTENELEIKSQNLPKLLEELYYWMGKEVYDTYTLKQQENADKLKDCNVYFDENRKKFIPFPRINTYGLTHLLTNNAQGVMRHKDWGTTVKKLKKTSPEKLILFQDYFEKNKLKLLSKLYFNEPYTKITRLVPLKQQHLNHGNKRCYLTGESYAELVDTTNISPFFSGISNFNSQLSDGDKKISWKTRYLSMFSPVCAFYHYPNKLRETVYVYLFNSNNLDNLRDVLNKVEIGKSLNELRVQEFTSNIKLVDELKKDGFTEQYEVAFVLIYSIYKKVLKKYGNIDGEQLPDDELFGNVMDNIPPFSIDLFKANQFASTMRPNSFESINRLSEIMNIIHQLEKEGVRFNRLFSSFKILKPTDRNAKNKFRLERILRDKISNEFLNKKSVLNSIEELFFRCYNYLCTSEYVGFKDYNQIFLFFQLYESKINIMEEKLQEASITLGKQIGIKMRHHDKDQNDSANAQKGRGDLIGLRKARTHKQFLDELIHIDFKYGLTINEELANKINDQNYYTIKQFLIIGALNILNPAIHPHTKTGKNA